jgi:hypothetical protein
MQSSLEQGSVWLEASSSWFEPTPCRFGLHPFRRILYVHHLRSILQAAVADHSVFVPWTPPPRAWECSLYSSLKLNYLNPVVFATCLSMHAYHWSIPGEHQPSVGSPETLFSPCIVHIPSINMLHEWTRKSFTLESQILSKSHSITSLYQNT